MSNALEQTLSDMQKERVLKEQAKHWQGKAHYFSPRAPESWDVPPHLDRFEFQSATQVNRVVARYGAHLAKELGKKSVGEVVADHKKRAKFADWNNPANSRLSSFEEAFRVDPHVEDKPKRGGLLGWLFGKRKK